MSEPQTTEPTTIRAGDSVIWTRNLPLYPPGDGWVLKYRFLWQVPPAVAVTAVAAGDLHRVELSSATTAPFPAGRATLAGWVERSGDRVTLGQSVIEVLQDLTAATSFDGRSSNERALTRLREILLEAIERGRVLTEEYTIAGRTMRFRSMKELQDMVSFYEREVAKETARAGGATGRVNVRF